MKERALHLVEDIKVYDARVAYPNDCFVLGEFNITMVCSFLLP